MEGTHVPQTTIVLPAEPASAARAREFVRDLVRQSHHQGLEDAAVLCVTELVANVSLHTDSTECAVTVVDEPEDILIEVADGDGSCPTLEHPARLAEHGRGLGIVDALAGEWGVEPCREAGKSVWARLRARP